MTATTDVQALAAEKGHSLMAGLDFSRSSRVLTVDDEGFHAPDPTAPHWTETSWWGFASADKGIGGWIYLRARPNLGLIACGIYVFDTRRTEMWDAIYHADFHHVALPPGQSYLNLSLDNGLTLVCEEPFKRHRITYRDDDFALDLTLTSVAEPWAVGVGPTTGHIDQAMWAKGEIACGSEHFAIDDPAFRDRTWSGRSDNARCPLNYYTWGTTRDRADTFYAAAGGIIAGRSRIDGAERRIIDIKRSVPQRDASGRPQRVLLQLTHEDGSRAEALGRVVLSYPVMALPRTLAWSSVVEWTLADRLFVGEDHEGWSFEHTRRVRRDTGSIWSEHL